VQNLAKGLDVPYDVQECEGDGWAILDFRRHLIEFVGGVSGFPSKLGGYGSGDGEFVFPAALAWWCANSETGVGCNSLPHVTPSPWRPWRP
jgi:hypothetical protein